MLSHRCLPRQAAGFTLVEGLTVVLILAVIAGLAAPSFSRSIANYKVRTASEGILIGLKLARAEAIRLNTQVALTLDAGGGWTVATVSPAQTLQTRPGSEAGGNLQITSLNDQTALTFLPTGWVLSYNPASNLTRVTVSSADGGADPLRIDVFAGGAARMCDPGITAADDPRKC